MLKVLMSGFLCQQARILLPWYPDLNMRILRLSPDIRLKGRLHPEPYDVDIFLSASFDFIL
jgi:hypothetical protein